MYYSKLNRTLPGFALLTCLTLSACTTTTQTKTLGTVTDSTKTPPTLLTAPQLTSSEMFSDSAVGGSLAIQDRPANGVVPDDDRSRIDEVETFEDTNN